MKQIAVIVAVVASTFFWFGSPARGIIKVSSSQSTDAGGNVRTQALITDPTGIDHNARNPADAGVTAVAIIRITASIIVRDSASIPDGLTVSKTSLSSAQAFGDGQTNGYDSNPNGSWQGLEWPYRDQYDYFAGPFDPPADSVGTFFQSEPDVYGFINVDGIARGGPTDEVPPPGMDTVAWLLRGETGNGGASGPASYFDFNIADNSDGQADPDRFVTLQIVAASARVVVVDGQGNYSEMQVPIDDFTTSIQLPEPASISAIGTLALAALLRRRRS